MTLFKSNSGSGWFEMTLNNDDELCGTQELLAYKLPLFPNSYINTTQILRITVALKKLECEMTKKCNREKSKRIWEKRLKNH